MQQYFRSVIQLCLLRGTPENLPYSWPALGLLMLVHFGMRWGGLTMLPNTEDHNLFLIALSWMLLSVGLVYGLLLMRGMTERWLKVTLALLSIEVVCLVILKVMMSLFMVLSLKALAALFVNGAVIWVLLIKSYIFQKGLGTHFLIGLLCTLSIEILSNLPASVVLIDAIEQMEIQQQQP